MNVVNVQIVRPKRPFIEGVLVFVGRFFLGGWLVMLILGAITDLHVGYSHSVLFLVLVRLLVANDDYLAWTKAPK